MAPQKRCAQEADSLLGGVKAVVVDIEGTTTPISFVKETLFPFVTDNLDTYLKKHYDDTETQKDIAALRSLAAKDKSDSVDGVVEIPESSADKEEILKAVAENVRWQMSNDRKSTELKQLQGHVWQEGYESGRLKGELFDDVAAVIQQLSEEGIKLYVYSSGSVEAQKLLFANTQDGDLVEMFTDFFDTTIGSKTESSSYKTIVTKVGCENDEILFLTDTPEEAKAACQAGLRSTLVIRPGNQDLTEEHLQNFSCIEKFEELYGDDDYDEEDLKRFEGDDNGEAEDDDEDPDEDEDDDEVEEENPEEEDDA
ncbi:enolase-phosphatase E1-like [Haliotis rubra]|uniref:enolase-phosphatase E1-like n=1 Tax=Haliotis rubra TaxID=36100 RepID=UPI001EE5A56C|nr:enolase-phosphatase E1-like [Haliotis rubra]